MLDGSNFAPNAPKLTGGNGIGSGSGIGVASNLNSAANANTNSSPSNPSAIKVEGLMDLSGDKRNYPYERLVTILSEPDNVKPGDFTSRREGDVLYVTVKNAVLAPTRKTTMDGDDGAYTTAELKQNGDNVVLTVNMKENTRHWVWVNNGIIVQVDFKKGARKY
jgi:hypothetical protein